MWDFPSLNKPIEVKGRQGQIMQIFNIVEHVNVICKVGDIVTMSPRAISWKKIQIKMELR